VFPFLFVVHHLTLLFPLPHRTQANNGRTVYISDELKRTTWTRPGEDALRAWQAEQARTEQERVEKKKQQEQDDALRAEKERQQGAAARIAAAGSALLPSSEQHKCDPTPAVMASFVPTAPTMPAAATAPLLSAIERERSRRFVVEQLLHEEQHRLVESEALVQKLKEQLQAAQHSLLFLKTASENGANDANRPPLHTSWRSASLVGPVSPCRSPHAASITAIADGDATPPTRSVIAAVWPSSNVTGASHMLGPGVKVKGSMQLPQSLAVTSSQPPPANDAGNATATIATAAASSTDQSANDGGIDRVDHIGDDDISDDDDDDLFDNSHMHMTYYEEGDRLAEEAEEAKIAASEAVEALIKRAIRVVHGTVAIEKGCASPLAFACSDPGTSSPNLFQQCTANLDIEDGVGSLKLHVSQCGLRTITKKIKSLRSGEKGVDVSSAARLGCCRLFFKDNSCVTLHVGEEQALGFADAVKQCQQGKLGVDGN
jgi:hypothetical protein